MFALQSRLSEKLTSVRVDSHYLYSIDFKPKVNFSDSRLEVNFLQFFIYSAQDMCGGVQVSVTYADTRV